MSSQLILPCLGRPFNLGMLYDCHSERLIPGKTLWNSKTLKSALQAAEQPSSNFEVFAEDTIQTKSSSLDIDANLKLSFLCGLVEVRGAAKFLDDKKSSEMQARVTLKYTTTTRFEQLTMEQLGAIEYPDVLADHRATHVVTGVTYGSDAFFVFDRSVSTAEEYRDVHGEMEAKIKFIPVEGSASLNIKEENKSKSDNFHCKFYGDLILRSNPSTFDEAVKVYRELPQLLNGDTGDRSVPKTVYLYPLAELDGKPQQIVRSISSSLTSQVELIMESFHEMEMRANDLKKHNICSKFVDIDSQISAFLNLTNQFKLNFMKKLSTVLPRIRSSGAEENELAELISLVSESPFSTTERVKFLRGKDKEIKQLAQYIKNMSNEPKIQFDFPPTDCDLVSLTIDDQIERVICFAFNVTSEASTFIENLEHYMKTGETVPKTKSKEWPDRPDVSKNLRLQSKNFTDFVKANSKSESAVFVVTDHNEETDVSGPAIILYIDGTPMDFKPPGKPGTPEASSITNNSVDLTWTEPKQAPDTVISYLILYRSIADSEPQRATTKAETSIRIGGLSPGTEYNFQVQAVSEHGLSIESESCTIQTKGIDRLADDLLKQSELIKAGNPAVYRLPSRLVHGNNSSTGPYKYEIGSPKPDTPPRPEKVLWLLGQSGGGKTTLINGITNFLLGVSWKDNFRFQITTEEDTKPVRTKNITAYALHCTNLPYTLTIVDSPGGSMDEDDYEEPDIEDQLGLLFAGKGGIDHLDGIGFVSPASSPPSPSAIEEISEMMTKGFGKNGTEKIFLLATFAGIGEFKTMPAIFKKKIFKFNNSALFAPKNMSIDPDFGPMFWNMGHESYKYFFEHFPWDQSRGLPLTEKVAAKF